MAGVVGSHAELSWLALIRLGCRIVETTSRELPDFSSSSLALDSRILQENHFNSIKNLKT